MPITSSTYWCASSCLSTSRTVPHGCPYTSVRDSEIVRVARCQAPRRVDVSASSSAGGRSAPRKWLCASSAQVLASSRSSAASSAEAEGAEEGEERGAGTASQPDLARGCARQRGDRELDQAD